MYMIDTASSLSYMYDRDRSLWSVICQLCKCVVEYGGCGRCFGTCKKLAVLKHGSRPTQTSKSEKAKKIVSGGIWTHECEHSRTWVYPLGPLGHTDWYELLSHDIVLVHFQSSVHGIPALTWTWQAISHDLSLVLCLVFTTNGYSNSRLFIHVH